MLRDKDNCKNPAFIVLYFITVWMGSLYLFIFWSYQTFHLPPLVIFKEIISGLYLPNHNIFISGRSHGLPVVVLLSFYFISLSIALLLYPVCFHGKYKNLTFGKVVIIISFLNLLSLGVLQQMQRLEHFKKEYSRLYGKETAEKNSAIFGPSYIFAETVKEKMSGYCQAEIISDADTNNDPFMIEQRVLSYFFYPKISLRFDNGSPRDCLLYFHKKNALNLMPQNYQVLHISDNQQYILAVKKMDIP